MNWPPVPLALTVLLQSVAARIHATPEMELDDDAAYKAARVKLQVEGDDAMVMNEMRTASQLHPQHAAPATAMGLPPSAVSFGVQEAELRQIHAPAKWDASGSTDLPATVDAIGSKNLSVGRLPSGGPYYSLKPLGVGSQTKNPGAVNYSEEAYAIMMQWKLVVCVFFGCLLATFLLGPVFGCLGMLFDISLVSLLMTRAGYGKETARSTHIDA